MTDWLVQRCIRRPEDGSDPAVRQAYGLLSGGVGIVLNLLLSAGKFVADSSRLSTMPTPPDSRP